MKKKLSFLIATLFSTAIIFHSDIHAASLSPPSSLNVIQSFNSEDRSLHTTKYIVTAVQTTLRTGPGTSYSSAVPDRRKTSYRSRPARTWTNGKNHGKEFPAYNRSSHRSPTKINTH